MTVNLHVTAKGFKRQVYALQNSFQNSNFLHFKFIGEFWQRFETRIGDTKQLLVRVSAACRPPSAIDSPTSLLYRRRLLLLRKSVYQCLSKVVASMLASTKLL